MAEPRPWSHERRDVRASFERAAASYDAAAVLQHEVGRRLLERLEWMRLAPQRVADLGCGTGRQTAGLRTRYPQAEVVALDLAEGMLGVARRAQASADAAQWVCGDLNALPFADCSADLLFSNLALQWCLDPVATFAELRRVLRPGGLLLFSTFGPDTLGELRASWSEVDGRNHVNAFFDLHDLGDALVRARLADPVMDCERITLTYPDVVALMRDLKAIGAHNVTAGRPRGLTGRRALATLAEAYATFRHDDGRLPATYEVVYGHAWRSPADTGEAVVPASTLRRRP